MKKQKRRFEKLLHSSFEKFIFRMKDWNVSFSEIKSAVKIKYLSKVQKIRIFRQDCVIKINQGLT